MAFKNKNVSPAKANGVGATGNPKPLANMPANNVGMHPVKLGAGQKSTFGHNTSGKGLSPSHQPTGSPKAKMPAHNGPRSSVQLGTTKHGLGGVPGYLRGK